MVVVGLLALLRITSAPSWSGDKLPGVAHVLVIGQAVVGAGRLQGSVEVAGHGGVFRELDGRSRVLRGMIAVAALVEELDLGHGSEALVLVGEGEAELIRLDRCEVHGVVVRARSGRGTGLLPDGLPGSPSQYSTANLEGSE